MEPQKFGPFLREARKQRGLTQEQLAACLHDFPVYHIAQVWLPSYYDTGEVSLLAYIGSREDRRTAQTVLDQAEQAFSDIGQSSYEEAIETYGQLGGYCITDNRVSAETHRLDLWSARFEGRTGYMWVYYSRAGFDATGNRVTGSRNIPVLWRLGKSWDGGWVVMDIKEHP